VGTPEENGRFLAALRPSLEQHTSGTPAAL